MAVNGIPGRYKISKTGGVNQLLFEKGIFCENECCNLRIRDGIKKYYGIDVGFWEKTGDLEKYKELARTKYNHLIIRGLG